MSAVVLDMSAVVFDLATMHASLSQSDALMQHADLALERQQPGPRTYPDLAAVKPACPGLNSMAHD